MMTGRLGCSSLMRGSRSMPLSPGRARSSSSRSYWLRESRSRPEWPSGARVMLKPSSVSRVSIDSRMAASSSIMRILTLSGVRMGRCGWSSAVSLAGAGTAVSVRSDSSEISVSSGMNGLPLFGVFRDGRGGFGEGSRRSGGGREVEEEDGAHPDLAFDMNLAGVLLKDAVGDGEAEAGAFMLAGFGLGFGGEEGIVDTVEMLEFDSGSVVLDTDEDAAVALFGLQA